MGAESDKSRHSTGINFHYQVVLKSGPKDAKREPKDTKKAHNGRKSPIYRYLNAIFLKNNLHVLVFNNFHAVIDAAFEADGVGRTFT